jgi:hypothetical protein
MTAFIMFIFGLLVGGIGGFLIWRNNKARIESLEQKIRDLKS